MTTKNNFNYKSSVLAVILKTIAIIVFIGYVIASIILNSGITFALSGISYALVLYTLATITQNVYEIKQLQEYRTLAKDEENK